MDRTSSPFDRSVGSAHPRAHRGGAVHLERFTSGQLLWAKPARSRGRVTAKQARCRPWHWASSTDARSQPRWLGSEALGLDVVARSSERANCSLGCPAAVGCSRLSAGNTHGSLLVDRHCGWSRPCRPWTVNPSRKLRRFESFTYHHVLPCGPAVVGSNLPTTAVREEYVRKLPQRAALRQPWSVPTQPRCVSESN